MSAATVEQLAELVSVALTRTQQQVLLQLKAFANESGLTAARAAQFDALAGIEATQDQLRQAQDDERQAKGALADATVEAEWEIRDRRVEKSGNKTFWVSDDDDTEMVEGDDGIAVATPTGRKVRIPVTAAEATERLTYEARRHPAVVEAAELLRKAEEATHAARDRRDNAGRRFSACQGDLSAATAQLQALTTTLPLVLQETNR